MDTAERRRRRYKKIQQRQRIIDQSGLRGGTLYERHRQKITKNNGYLAKHGSVLHYAQGNNGASNKTRDRQSWSGTNNWSAKDQAQIEKMQEDLEESLP